jgi:hypothetical protein
MSQDTENFEQLRRMLALKRHEQPPPGYFNDFSRQVILRIKAGERGEPANLLERLFWEAPWVQRLWNTLEARPIVAGACGVAVCGLMITGVLYSDRADVPAGALVPIAQQTPPPTTDVAFAPTPPIFEPTGAKPVLTTAPAEGSLLGELQATTKLQADRIAFTFPGRN